MNIIENKTTSIKNIKASYGEKGMGVKLCYITIYLVEVK